MDTLIPQLALAVPAIWLWVWLARTAHRDLPRVIYIQQNLGISYPRFLYRLAMWGRWLAVGGLPVVGASFIHGAMPIVAAGMFSLGAGLLMYIHTKVARLLNPRVVDAVLLRLLDRDGPGEDRDGPGDPVPA